MASLSGLSNEVIVLIGEACGTRERSCFARANRRLHDLVNPVLYRHNVRQGLASAAFWAARHGRVDTLELLRIGGAEWNDNSASRLESVYRSLCPHHPAALQRVEYDVFFTPLHIAAMFGQDSAVRWLLYVGPFLFSWRAFSRVLSLTTHQ